MEPESQLELFHVPTERPRRRPHSMIGMTSWQIRQDHFMLLGIASLVGVSVVFALGVERGKRLARAERPLLIHSLGASSVRPAPTSAAPESLSAPAGLLPSRPAPSSARRPASGPERKEPSRYAIQVVTYSRPALAQRELQRLQQRGERAFLVVKQGRVVLFVGPFPTKENASAKLTSLRQRYQDCFIRSL